jgi:transposase InsO family protein
MMFPLVRDLAADGIPVAVTCRVLGFSKQSFYRWKANPVCRRDWDDAHLINAVYGIHADDPAFGYRFIADELAVAGIQAGRNRVARLCSQQRIWSVFAKRKGLSRKAGPPVHDDLVQRRFRADRRDQVWLTDITEHHTAEGKLYLCAVKDVYSNRIVGYSIDSRMKARLAVTALHNAMAFRHPAGTTVHSDRGSQGGFNGPSQHLDLEVVRWAIRSGRWMFGSTGARFRHRDGRRWPGVKTGSGSGRRSRAARRLRTRASRRASRVPSGSGGSATLAV